jgi:hypothetical protein
MLLESIFLTQEKVLLSTFQDILARVYIRIGVAQQAGNLIQRMCSANTIISSVFVWFPRGFPSFSLCC